MSLKLHVLGQSWAPSQERPFVSRHKERSDALAGSNEWNCPCEGEEVRAGRKQKKGGRKMAEKKTPKTGQLQLQQPQHQLKTNKNENKHNDSDKQIQAGQWQQPQPQPTTVNNPRTRMNHSPHNIGTTLTIRDQSTQLCYSKSKRQTFSTGTFDATFFFGDYPIYWIENGKKLSAATEKQFMPPSETHSKTNGHKCFFNYTPLKWLKSLSLLLNPSYGSCWCV